LLRIHDADLDRRQRGAVTDVAVVVALALDAVGRVRLEHPAPVVEFLDDRRRPDGRDRVVIFQANRFDVVVFAEVEGSVHRKGHEVRNMPAEEVDDADAGFGAVQRDVEVEAEVDAVAAERAAVDESTEAGRLDQPALLHRRGGVDAACDDAQAQRRGGLAHHPPQLDERALDLGRRRANGRRHLDDAIVQVAFYAVGSVAFRDALEQRVDLVGQRAVAVKQREFLFDAEMEFGISLHGRTD
jgi:hypothetical protein